MTFNPQLLLVIAISVGIYLGLAVLGSGGVAAFVSHPALIAVGIVTVLLAVAAVFSRGNLSSGEHEDRSNRWVIGAFGLVGLLDAGLPAYTERIGFWVLGGEPLRWAGVVLYAVGGLLRIGPVFVLGRRFSGLVAIQPGHTLVTTGMYRVIRNPSYLGLLVMMFGWGLVFRSSVGVILAGLIVPPLVARIRAEERLLGKQFGAEYAAYCARTWRLLPGLY